MEKRRSPPAGRGWLGLLVRRRLPGFALVLDKLVLGTQALPPSFLGPPETAYPAASLK